jgi:3-deoxy-D-manno-octulosonic-acid transferase
MSFIYNTVLKFGQILLSAIGRHSSPKQRRSKLRKFIDGQRGVLEHIAEVMATDTRDLPTYWIHAASLGEFGVARPIIRRLREQQSCRIVITFFSSTGYEAISANRERAGVDHVFYLPLDTKQNASRFLDIVKPHKAVFMISEYWLNYLSELRTRAIPTYLVSAIITDKAPFFKWYGCIYRKALATYTNIMVLNEQSRDKLERLGYHSAVVTGDPLFDNVIAMAETPWSDPIIERFANGRKLLIAGSIHEDKDLELVSAAINRHTDVFSIIVPHEIHPDTVANIKSSLCYQAKAYSECGPDTDFKEVRTLIIDFVGALGYIYRYGKWAYIGGGFTPYLHSIIEATAYGLPTAFGPNTERKVTPAELVDLGIGCIVTSADELDTWLCNLRADENRTALLAKGAIKYTRHNQSATTQIVDILTQNS